jgi:hypothetical protein
MAASNLSEKQFQAQVIDLLHMYGYRVAHFMPAVNMRGQWRTPVAADGKGFPDLVAARAELSGRNRPGRVMFIELKTDVGRLSKEQREWHDDLVSGGAESYVWKPRDWTEIVETVR